MPGSKTRVAILAADGVERTHVERVRRALEAAGIRVDLVGPRKGEVWAMDDLDRSATFPVDRPLRDATAGDFDCLVVPGGVAGVDHLRRDPAAIGLVADFGRAGKPLGAVAHAVWLLIEADLVRDRTLTSWPSIRADVVNAGGEWVDEAVSVSGSVLTCRRAEDLPDFCDALLEALE